MNINGKVAAKQFLLNHEASSVVCFFLHGALYEVGEQKGNVDLPLHGKECSWDLVAEITEHMLHEFTKFNNITITGVGARALTEINY